MAVISGSSRLLERRSCGGSPVAILAHGQLDAVSCWHCVQVVIADIIKVKMESKLKAMKLLGKHHEVSAWEENVNLADGVCRTERMRRWQKRMGKRGPRDTEG